MSSVSDILGKVHANLFQQQTFSADHLNNELMYRYQLDSIFLFASEDMEMLSELLAKYHFYKQENKSDNASADRLKKAAEAFEKEFGYLPLEYIGGKHKFSVGLGTTFLRIFSGKRMEGMERAEHYQNKEQELIIHGSTFFKYKCESRVKTPKVKLQRQFFRTHER